MIELIMQKEVYMGINNPEEERYWDLSVEDVEQS